MAFNEYVFGPPYFGWLCNGIAMTLLLTAVSSLCAALAGVFVLRCHISRRGWVRVAGAAFVAVFRNLPLVPLLLVLTYAIPGLWRQALGHPFPSGLEFHLLLLALSFNTAAYLAQILLAGVAAVRPAQVSAARTLGLDEAVIRRRVIYPQAMRIVAPALASRFIHNMKNSTVALVIPLPVEMMEVVGQAGRIAGQTFSWAEPLVFAAAVHLTLALGLGWLLNLWAVHEQSRVGAGA